MSMAKSNLKYKNNIINKASITQYSSVNNFIATVNNNTDNTISSNINPLTFSNKNTSNSFINFIGIDVGKYKLDIYCSHNKSYHTVLNKEINIKEFINDKLNTISINPNNTLIIIDLTGGYEVLSKNTFYKLGFNNIHLAEGIKVKYFHKSILTNKAKTDKLDSKLLALYGEKMIDNLILYDPLSEDQIKLNQFLQRIVDLKAMKQREKNRLQAPNNVKLIQESIIKTIKTLETQIAKLETEILAIINSNETLKQVFNLLVNIKGIAATTAYTILAQLPELGKLNRRKIASLAGCAPNVKESCSINKYRNVKGGRPIIKKVLFTIVLVRIKTDKSTKERYQYLQAKGKKKLVAIVAIMRKLIITLNAKVKELYKNLEQNKTKEQNKTITF